MIMKEDRKTFVAYSPMPVNKVTPRCFNTMFKMLRIVGTKYNVVLIAKNKKQLKYYKESIGDSVKNIEYVLFGACTHYENDGKDFYYDSDALQKQMKSKLKSCDVFYMFSSIGMIPKSLLNGSYRDLKAKDKIKVTFHSNVGTIFTVDLARIIINEFKPRFFSQINDYNEPNIDGFFDGYPVTMLGFYDESDKGGYKHSYNVEYDKFTQLPEKLPKTIDFTFGYLMMVASRKYLSDFVQDKIVETDKVKIHCQDKFWRGGKRDDLIPVAEYYEEQARSKFTLAPPATVITEISTERIYDALVRDCFPIFMKITDYRKVFKEDFCKFIDKWLVFDEDKFATINDFIKTLDYDKILADFKKVKSIQDLYNINEDKVLNTFEEK